MPSLACKMAVENKPGVPAEHRSNTECSEGAEPGALLPAKHWESGGALPHVALPLPLTLFRFVFCTCAQWEIQKDMCPCQILERNQTEVLKDRYVPSRNAKTQRDKSWITPYHHFFPQVKWTFYISLFNFFFFKWVKTLSLIQSLQLWYIRYQVSVRSWDCHCKAHSYGQKCSSLLTQLFLPFSFQNSVHTIGLFYETFFFPQEN